MQSPTLSLSSIESEDSFLLLDPDSGDPDPSSELFPAPDSPSPSLSPLSETSTVSEEPAPSTEDGHRTPLLPPQPCRIQMHTNVATASFTDELRSRACFTDLDGAPVFVGSALINGGVHPCKVTLSKLGKVSPVRVPLGGREVLHEGRFEILHIDDETMEWVSVRDGWVPPDRSPVEGGYERNMSRLYYAVTNIKGIMVPGKAIEYNREYKRACAYFSWDGRELEKKKDYAVLCWRADFYVPAEGAVQWDPELAPFTDKHARAPMHLALVPFKNSLQPGKATLARDGVRLRTTYGGGEIDLKLSSAEQPARIIRFDPLTMKRVPTSHGRIPVGVQPVEGGYDSRGTRLYFAVYGFGGALVPGKTGEHLRAAHFSWCGTEQVIRCGYDILCWRRSPESGDVHRSLVPPPPSTQFKGATTQPNVDALEDDKVCLGTAHRDDQSRHPGTATRGATSMVFSYDGRGIVDFSGPFHTLKFDAEKMEWVSARKGKIPAERRPIEGGYEVRGDRLFFARCLSVGPYIYGKSGEHLSGAHFVKEGKHVMMRDGYDILCWKD